MASLRTVKTRVLLNICNHKKANIYEQKLKMEVPVKKKKKKKEIIIPYLVPQPQSVSRSRIH